MMNKIYLQAAISCQKVYEENYDMGTTEFDIQDVSIAGKRFQILSIAGTNEIADWPINFNLMSIDGIKKGAYLAAYDIIDSDIFSQKRNFEDPLIITGHSKAGATAIAFHKITTWNKLNYWPTKGNICVAFAPARSLRYWTNRHMGNTTIFTDPDDPVSSAGRISFGHPKCNHIKAKNNHFGLSIPDHNILNWVEFCKRRVK